MLKQKAFYQKMLAAFLPFFVLVEVYRGLAGDTLSLGPFAVEEIAVILYVLILFFAAAAFALKEKRTREILVAGGYFLLAAAYLAVHSLHAARFDPAVFPDAKPDFWIESYYYLRQYALPAALLAATAFLAPPKKEILAGIRLASFLTAAAIVLTDLFGVSFAAYVNGRERVDGGFFSWFSLADDAPFHHYTAKGPFLIHNVTGAFLFALAPFSVLSLWKEKKWTDAASLAVQGLAMVMLGTKVASFGFLLTLGAYFAAFFAGAWKRKETKKAIFPAAVTLILAAAFLPLWLLSPGYRWQGVRRADTETGKAAAPPGEERTISADDLGSLESYVYGHFEEHLIAWENLACYPVREDPEFWAEVMRRDRSLNESYRSFKLELADRVKERRGDPLDAVLGVGYTSLLPYSERDFADQYNLFGAAGLIVILLPIAFAGGRGLFDYLKRLFAKKEAAFPGTVLFSLAALAATGVAAGHVLGSLLNTYVSFFLSGLCLVWVRETGRQV